jgi:hypothetical protein
VCCCANADEAANKNNNIRRAHRPAIGLATFANLDTLAIMTFPGIPIPNGQNLKPEAGQFTQ